MDIKRFDIVEVDLKDNEGSEQGKIRPCVVVNNEKGNKFGPMTFIVPLTHVIKCMHLPTHTFIPKNAASGLKMDSMAVGEQSRAIDKSRIKRKLGSLTDPVLKIGVTEVWFANFMGERYIPEDVRLAILAGEM